jgi:hypothetical protein
MAGITESLEELTTALQALAADDAVQNESAYTAVNASPLPAETLSIPGEVSDFVKQTQEYSNKTRDVSIGTY